MRRRAHQAVECCWWYEKDRLLMVPGYPDKRCAHSLPCLKLGFPTCTPLSTCSPAGKMVVAWPPDLGKARPDGQDTRETGQPGFCGLGAEESSQAWSPASTNNSRRVKDYFLSESPWRQPLKTELSSSAFVPRLKQRGRRGGQVQTSSLWHREREQCCSEPARRHGGWGVTRTVLML